MASSGHFLIREAEDRALIAVRTAAELRELQSNAFAHDVPMQLPRMLLWPADVAAVWFESGGRVLPSHWRAIPLTHTDVNLLQDEECRSREAAIAFLAPPSLPFQFELRYGEVRLSMSKLFDTGHVPASTFSWIDQLGECGDLSCGCCRLGVGGDVREAFAQQVINHTLASLPSTAALRFVTLGCGGCLTDAQILCGLMRNGVHVESVVAVDASFVSACGSGYMSVNDDDDEEDRAEARGEPRVLPQPVRSRITASSRDLAALDQLARLVAPAPVYAFCASAALVDACVRRPRTYGDANLVVHCDATALAKQTARLAAACALRAGGYAFALYNVGGAQDDVHRTPAAADAADGCACDAGHASASTQCWRREADGVAQIMQEEQQQHASCTAAPNESGHAAGRADAWLERALVETSMVPAGLADDLD